MLHSYSRIKARDLSYSMMMLSSPQRMPSTMNSGLQTSSTLQECKKIKIEYQSVSNDITQPMEHALFLILITPTPASHPLQNYNATKSQLSPKSYPQYITQPMKGGLFLILIKPKPPPQHTHTHPLQMYKHARKSKLSPKVSLIT